MVSNPPGRAFRLVCAETEVPLVEKLLHLQGFAWEPEPFCTWARFLTQEPFPLGRSLAAVFGLIYIQDRSSMLPALALDPALGTRVLDMCASPGSKTSLLAQLVGSSGLVLGNEPSRSRLNTLRQNLLHLNLWQSVTCSWAGESLPLAEASFSQILLDPPCSGWGTVERHPGVEKLWYGDKVKPLINLQQALLREAYRLLMPGGQMVYSTCTTNVAENEEQVRYALGLGFELLPLPAYAGFAFCEPLLDLPAQTLRTDQTKSAGQGFYIAKLRKPFLTGQPAIEKKLAGPALLAEQLEINSEPKRGDLAVAKPYHALSRQSLEEFGLDPQKLPAGDLAKFGDNLHFLPQPALELLPSELRWQGMILGKTAGLGFIPSPQLRGLISHLVEPRLELDDLDKLNQLLQGQSWQTGLSGKTAALFWQGLALGQVRLKQGRALWCQR